VVIVKTWQRHGDWLGGDVDGDWLGGDVEGCW